MASIATAKSACKGPIGNLGGVGDMPRRLHGRGAFLGRVQPPGADRLILHVQVYDRVIPSHSVLTLTGLSVLMIGLFAFNGIVELTRTRVLSRIGVRLDSALRPRAFDAMLMLPIRAGDRDSWMTCASNRHMPRLAAQCD